MPKAIWNGVVIAEASDTAVEIVEGNIYFPMETVNQSYLQSSDTETECHWKGTANYFHLAINGVVNRDAVWIYRQPKVAAKQIAGHVAFWRGVDVQK
jgi:uncharacterized protein (DUF427 family)